MRTDSPDILLIEDNLYDAELTLRALKKHHLGNNLLHLNDGAEALEYFFPNGNKAEPREINPRLIILDLKLPKINGIEVLAELKKNSSTRTIPVVVFTSSREQPDLEECYKLGVNSYVVKPVEFEVFTNTVAELGLYWLLLNQTERKIS